MEKLGFVGLGVMGGPMAGHLISKGFDVTVYNRTLSKAAPFSDLGAKISDSLEGLAESSSVIFLCVSRTEDVEECLAKLLPAAKPGTLFVDHSTISPEGAKRIQATVAEHGCSFIDAPITGGSVGAQKGLLTIFCGGSEPDFERVNPFLNAYAKKAAYVGGPGAGQMTKMANQIAVGGALLALCEALAFARRAGLDISQTHELLSGGAAGSWAFDNYGPKILAGDWSPGFSIINQRKDFGYCQEAGDSLNMPLPLTSLADKLLQILDSQGKGELTTAALYDAYLEMTL